MKRQKIIELTFHPKTFVISALMQAYQLYKYDSPDGFAFSVPDNDGSYTFCWEDIKILYHLSSNPTAQHNYYNLLIVREDVLNGDTGASDAAEYLSTRIFS